LNDIGYIKKRLEEKFQIIYQKKDSKSYNKKEKEDLVIGFAIYI
jgi:hypothetical protein